MGNMENKVNQSVVKDLDVTLQPRPAPRYKVWLPLATQQLRLRCLNQLIGYNLQIDKNFDICWFYFTLHRSSMSSPLYTSEPIDNINPKWLCIELSTLHATGLSTANEIVLRLWRRTMADDPNTDITVFTWGISFTGLVYMGPKLSNNLDSMLRKNSLIFNLHGGYFVPPYCLIHPPEFRRYLHMSVNNSEICDSYTVSKLSNLRRLMQSLNLKNESVQALRDRIASGESVQSPKFKQTALNRLLQPKRMSKEKKHEILRMGKELEIAKFRTKLLEQERIRKVGELRTLNQLHLSIMEENEDQGSLLMGRYRELNKDIERLREWRQNHIQARECYVETLAQLAYRQRQLMSDLNQIYPIRQELERKFTINDVHLPDSEELDKSNDIETSVALGFVAHTTQMVANFLSIPTRYSIIYYGSRTRIIDHITDNISVDDRQFPLFSRSKDKLQFHYGVYLLNKNIAQLRWYCGLPTSDLRATLPNLASLINLKTNQSLDSSKRTFSGSSLDTDTSTNGKHNVPLICTVENNVNDSDPKMIFPPPSRTLSQFKSLKTTLGSSLDQGLDKPPHSFIGGMQMKRIYKSEDSAIDDEAYSLPQGNLSSCSDETVYHTDTNYNEGIHGTSNTSTLLSSGLIGRDIEITVPTSICHEKYEDVCLRQRSSNSISSCEMALTSSQTDVDERLKDVPKHKIIDSKNRACSLLSVKCTNPLLIASDCSCSGDEITCMNEVEPMATIFVGSKHDDAVKESNFISRIRCDVINNIETFTTSMRCVNDTRSLCVTIGKRDEINDDCTEKAEAFHDESVDENLTENPPAKFSFHSNKYLRYEWDVNGGATCSLSRCQQDGAHETVKEYQASSDFINSMRKSSENVFARTEALASKKTSFKLMKPRS